MQPNVETMTPQQREDLLDKLLQERTKNANCGGQPSIPAPALPPPPASLPLSTPSDSGTAEMEGVVANGNDSRKRPRSTPPDVENLFNLHMGGINQKLAGLDTKVNQVGKSLGLVQKSSGSFQKGGNQLGMGGIQQAQSAHLRQGTNATVPLSQSHPTHPKLDRQNRAPSNSFSSSEPQWMQRTIP